MKVIILCGGKGARLREETEYKPKPMVEIGGKPILWHIMKLYAYFGFKEFILALGYKGNIIRDYFLNYNYYNNDFTVCLGDNSKIKIYANHDEHDWKVTLVNTGEESMTGFRVKLCRDYINEDDFMLTYGDAVADVNILKLTEFHKLQGTIGTVTGVYPPSRFGDLISMENKVLRFKEKVVDLQTQNPINGGFFVFKKEFLNYINDDPKSILEEEPITKLVNENQLSMYKHKNFWQCMDTYRDFELLNEMWNTNPKWKIW